MDKPFPYRTGFWVILALAWGLRLWLVAGGGQGYWPDENMRYGEAQTAALYLRTGQWAEAARELCGHADHTLFRWVAMPPALADIFFGPHPFRSAVYFGFFSVLVIGLVGGIARRAGADDAEIFWATLLAAASNSLFFYARHFFPYDASLALMLGAVYCALGPTGGWRGVGVGCLVGLGFLVYNGYWALGGAILIWHTLRGWPRWREVGVRGALAGLGLLLPVGLIILSARGVGADWVAGARANAGTIVQGDFGEGWRVVAAYLWVAEGWLGVLLVAGALVAAGKWVKGAMPPAAGHWLAIGGLFLLGLVLLSDLRPVFVVYGRIVRVMMPWLCLLGGLVLANSLRGRKIGWSVGVVGLVGLLAGLNFWSPLRQVYPDGFLRQVRGVVAAQQLPGREVYRVLNVEHLWGRKGYGEDRPHDVLWREPHPLQYRPYQYEGFSRAQRQELAKPDIAMEWVRLRGVTDFSARADDRRWAGYVGPVAIKVRLPAGLTRGREPLLTSGCTGAGDFFYVEHGVAGYIRLGWDHWDGAGWLSEPLPVDETVEHEIVFSGSALFPPAPANLYRDEPGWGFVRELFVVAFDGRVLACLPRAMHPTASNMVFFGTNFIGGSTTALGFEGQIKSVRSLGSHEFLGLLPALQSHFDWRPSEWAGAPGPFALEVEPAGLPVGQPLNLASRGGQGRGDCLALLKQADGRYFFRYQHLGAEQRSEPFAHDAGGALRLRVSLGSFMPAEDDFYAAHPGREPLRRLLTVEVNGQNCWTSWIDPFAAPAQWAFGRDLSQVTDLESMSLTRITRISAVDPDEFMQSRYRLSGMLVERSVLAGGFPGAVKIELQFPKDRRGRAEPLLASGVTGAGDFFYVRYEPDGQIRLGFDHWGVGGPLSDPLAIKPGATHELTVSAGFLYPPTGQLPGEWAALKETLWVELDGRVVLVARAAAHGTELEQLVLGVNTIGGSSCDRIFTGRIRSVRAVPPETVLVRSAGNLR